ncbi:pilus assembly protein N-terminal domain-containing protein [Antarctobacter heliothermus]|uniref:Pilus formation protein N terminal region n=1 Tax=Antarctobacter heliothermus TaxID=74033 RepID=A0A239DMG8_9RHOB|nr:pilus assembly protein N-terminal domain-containing protein [Antarctobacter heliothermus]SNS32874.1 Pilus formation protein N terminal region [Antarctobacter heliothermus]
MNKLLFSAACGVVFSLGLCAPVLAQEASFKVMGAGETVEVQAGHAVTLDFAVPFSELSIGDPDIADISTLSDKVVYLLGKTVASTTLTTISSRNPPDIGHVTVVVYRDITPMQAFLDTSAGEVALTRDGTVVTALGCVAGDRQRAALDSVLGQLDKWGYVTLADVGDC